MLSSVLRLNSRENEISTKAIAKYRAQLIKETAGTNYLRDSREIEYIDRLLVKHENARRQMK